MNDSNDWDSRSSDVQQDQIKAYDKMRQTCPVAHDEYLGYSVFRHADVVTILENPDIYSNAVSPRHIAVPNGMDAPLHTAFRAINDKYFTPSRMATFEPQCRQVIQRLICQLPFNQPIDIMAKFAKDYAIQIQNAFMGWPAQLEQPLIEWIEKNRQATLKQDRALIAQVALEFDGYIRQLLETRRQQPTQDITNELMHDEVMLGNSKRQMTEEELISLIRNWTVGELSTISACVGIIVAFLADNPKEQQRLREKPQEIPAAIEEILRLTDPLVTNRRITTCPVRLHQYSLPAGARITLNWTSANRDETAFDNSTEYNPHRNQENNLVYGKGIHACPGAPLARLELRLLVEELLKTFTNIQPSQPVFTENAIYPIAGYSAVYVTLT